jgi:hypothetical protein
MSKKDTPIVRVDGPIDPGKAGKPRYRTVMKDGEQVRIRVLDSNSPDFTAQFLSSFRNNVKKARKENSDLAKSA